MNTPRIYNRSCYVNTQINEKHKTGKQRGNILQRNLSRVRKDIEREE